MLRAACGRRRSKASPVSCACAARSRAGALHVEDHGRTSRNTRADEFAQERDAGSRGAVNARRRPAAPITCRSRRAVLGLDDGHPALLRSGRCGTSAVLREGFRNRRCGVMGYQPRRSPAGRAQRRRALPSRKILGPTRVAFPPEPSWHGRRERVVGPMCIALMLARVAFLGLLLRRDQLLDLGRRRPGAPRARPRRCCS